MLEEEEKEEEEKKNVQEAGMNMIERNEQYVFNVCFNGSHFLLFMIYLVFMIHVFILIFQFLKYFVLP